MNKNVFFLILFFLPSLCLADSPEQISVVYCTNIAPFEYTDEKGEPKGLIIDFWELWSEKTGVHVNFKKALWNDTLEMAAKGEVDAHAGLFYNKKRDTYLDYGSTLSETTTHIFFHKTITIPDTFEQISAYKIGVIKNDFVECYLKEHLPSAAITGYKDYKTLTDDLKSGELKVFAADTATGLFYLAREGLLALFHFDNVKPLYKNNWHIASKEGNQAMLDMISSGFDKISPEEKKRIERRWTSGMPSEASDAIIIAISRNYPPFSVIGTNGEPTGFLIDLWQEWAKIVNKPIKFRATNWSDTLSGINAGYADIHSGLFINPERETWLNFSSPFIKVDTAVFFKPGVTPFSLTEMQDQKIGIVEKSYQASFINKKYPGVEVRTYPEVYNLLSALFQEQVNAIVAEVPEITGALRRLGISGSVAQGDLILSNTVHAGVPKNNKILLDLVNQGFSSMQEQTFSTIKERWFPSIYYWKVHLKLIIFISISIVLLIIIGLYWNYKLRNELIYRKEMEQNLEEAKKNAESASLAKSMFLANMSHEIRTPMNAILGMNQLALETSLTSEQKHLLGTVQASSEHLLRLLDDILDFSKIEAGKLEIQHELFSLPVLFETVHAAMYPYTHAKGLTFETQIKDFQFSDCLIGDEFRIQQILYNLIGNAVKFTNQGSIIVKAELSKKQPVSKSEIEILISVADTGIGILPEKQDLIFSSFQQADTSIVREFGGTGLGLTISGQLSSLLGGRIWLESTPDVGTCFFFTLVLGVGQKQAEKNLKKESIHIVQNLKILVIEDNSINQDLAKIVLEKDHHRVVVAENGLEGLKQLGNETFDLVFMDIQMPVMDGLTACKIIRAFEKDQFVSQELPEQLILNLKTNLKEKHIPIVAMTANAMGGDREKYLKAGMDGYITKPFHFEAIRTTIAKLELNSLIKERENHFDSSLPEKATTNKKPAENELKSQVKDHLRTTYQLDNEQIEHMLEISTETLADNISEAETALKNKDYKRLGNAAHSIKGSLLNLGLNDSAKIAQKIESNGKKNIETDYKQLLAKLNEKLAGFL